MKLTKILLPVDFSEQGDGAAQQAAALARHFDAGLILLHVNPILVPALTSPREFSGPIDTGWITALEAQGRKELDTYHQADLGRNRGHEDRRDRRSGREHRRIRPPRKARLDRDADPRIRAFSQIPARLGHRQGPARCRRSGVDRRAFAEGFAADVEADRQGDSARSIFERPKRPCPGRATSRLSSRRS